MGDWSSLGNPNPPENPHGRMHNTTRTMSGTRLEKAATNRTSLEGLDTAGPGVSPVGRGGNRWARSWQSTRGDACVHKRDTQLGVSGTVAGEVAKIGGPPVPAAVLRDRGTQLTYLGR